jgi:hypothetical protein
MMDKEFRNNASQAERIAQFHNDKLRSGDRAGTTYFDQARVSQELENSGRFRAEAHHSGEAPSVQYPAAAGPWADPVRVPDEPSLGYAIDQQEVTGEAAEIAASLEFAVETASSSTLARVPNELSIPSDPPPAAMLGAAGHLAEPADPAPPAVDRGSAIPPEANAKLKALLGRGLRKSK